VLLSLAKVAEHPPELFAIEKSHVLLQAQPETITPVGVDFHEQNLSALPVDVHLQQPAVLGVRAVGERIIETAFAQRAYLVMPHRWKESATIAAALKKRGATART
jgi:hypothetical protein